MTGSEGFIGKHLCRYLLESGWSVEKFDIIFKKDILSLTDLLKTMQKSHSDSVIHLAANANVRWSNSHILEDLKINTIGTLNILEAMVKTDVKKLVFASTAQVYGLGNRKAIDERCFPKPDSAYAISKLTSEYYCELYAKRQGINVAILRFFNVYGIGQHLGYVIPDFFDMAIKGNINVKGNPKDGRDFINAEDLVKAIKLVSELAFEGVRKYNVCTGECTKMQELARKIACMLNAKVILQDDVDSQPRALFGKHNRLTRDTGWEPKISLDEGLAAIYEDIKKNNLVV